MANILKKNMKIYTKEVLSLLKEIEALNNEMENNKSMLKDLEQKRNNENTEEIQKQIKELKKKISSEGLKKRRARCADMVDMLCDKLDQMQEGLCCSIMERMMDEQEKISDEIDGSNLKDLANHRTKPISKRGLGDYTVKSPEGEKVAVERYVYDALLETGLIYTPKNKARDEEVIDESKESLRTHPVTGETFVVTKEYKQYVNALNKYSDRKVKTAFKEGTKSINKIIKVVDPERE